MSARKLTALALLLAGACSNNQNAIVPPSFDRPGRMALGCYRSDGATGQLRPLGECAGRDNEDDEEDEDPLRHIALVVQTARGEVGAVDLQERDAIDSDTLVPGYTFVRVGELPSAIVLPPDRPDVTFVASFGAQAIEAVPSTRFIPGAAQHGETPAVASTLALDEGPTDLAYFEVDPSDGAARFLFAPLPDAGTVVQVPVGADGTLGAATVLALGDTVTPQLEVVAPTTDDQRLCGFLETRAATPSMRVPVALGATPEPVRLRVVEGPTGRELLVADASLPLIHRFSLDATGATALPPIDTGTPVLDFAVTPLVPVALTDTVATQRFLYAIDATDRSVMAIDYGTGSPSFGAVIAMGIGQEASDRIPLRVRARTLEVGYPRYELDDAANVTSARCTSADELDRREEALPGTLRGVFLFVGALDGTFHTVDVHDLDAECRGGAMCGTPANEQDVYVRIRRHHPRMASLLDEPMELVASPSTSIEGLTTRVAEDGSTIGREDAVGLASITCPGVGTEELVRAFPTDDDALPPLVCITVDPWLALGQTWTAVFEGPLRHAAGGRGRFVTDVMGNPGAYFVAEDVDFCSVGTLGTEDVVASALPEGDPESGYGGDMLVVTGEMPPSTRGLPECAKFLLPEEDDSRERERIAFAIEAASPGVLRLGAALPGGLDTSFDEVRGCFPEPTAYAVHARDAFVVGGLRTITRHRVQDVGGACRVVMGDFDPTRPDTYRVFRAFPGRTFIAPEIAFELRAPEGGIATGTEVALGFQVGNVPGMVAVDAGTLVESMLYAPTGTVLYVVDAGATTGLVAYRFDTLARLFSVF